MEPIRLAVIGTGQMGRKHADFVVAHSACTLAGICDVDRSRESVAKNLNASFYQDVEELLDRERPHGAIIATPNANHADVAEACARRSVHVLIEKPIADSLDGAQRIVRAAQDAGIQVLVGHHRRHNPLVREAHSVVAGGALGKLVAVSMMWALLKPAEYYEIDWRCRRPGGGPTLINLIHELDLLRYVCGEIRQVYAQSSSTARQLDVEDTLTISISFENGALGSVVASDTTPSPWSYELTTHENPFYSHTHENCYYFLGTRGSLAFPKMELWRYTADDRAGWQHPLERTSRDVTRHDPLGLQLEHFCRVVRGGEGPLVDGQDGARSLAVVLAVLESIEQGAPVSLSAS